MSLIMSLLCSSGGCGLESHRPLCEPVLCIFAQVAEELVPKVVTV